MLLPFLWCDVVPDGATVGGTGTGSAVVGAYVLAGELAAAGGNHGRAFARYEELLRPFVTRCQEGGRRAGEFLAPPTAQEAIDARHALLNNPQAVAAMLQVGEAPRKAPAGGAIPARPTPPGASDRPVNAMTPYASPEV
ncbi:hypothetical protein ADK76_26235 [Streptomyces griseoflavus]|nr:hypothetical protein ADK76_26235 [Streptomyces griseoflavus]